MRLVITLLALALAVPAQEGQRQILQSFAEATAKATALLEAAEGRERKAREAGHSLPARIVARRGMLETAMDEAEALIRRREWKAAAEKLVEIRGHLSKLAAYL